MKYIFLMLICFAAIVACEPPKGDAGATEAADSTAVTSDSLVGNVEGVDSTLIND